jgi:peptide/nickel transport system substrate-binding protein
MGPGQLGASRFAGGLLRLLLPVILLAACGAPAERAHTPARDAASGQGQQQTGSSTAKSLTIGVPGPVRAFGLAGATTPIGGWMSTNELHSQGLITSDTQSRAPVGRLAERVPSFADGSIALLPDGRMRSVYPLRRGVTWQDGQPFTSNDLAFSYQLNRDPGLPFINREAIDQIDAIETPDDATFVAIYKGPFAQADTLGLRVFWPYPRHLLQEPYERYQRTRDADEFTNQPYWTSAYVNLGPYRVAEIQPGERVTLQAYAGYFLGRPKIDTIHIRTLGDENALFAAVLAGAVDLFMDLAMNPELGSQLQERWAATGGGTVHNLFGYTRFLTPQWRLGMQKEPTILDRRVRAALYHALDRPAISEAVQAGHRELVASGLLPTNHRSFAGTQDTLRAYAYDPGRARALLQEAGWTFASGSGLRFGSDGRRFETSVWANARWVQETALIADSWRQLGVNVEEFVIPGAMARDQEFRSTYPGWYTSSRYAEGILAALEEPPATAENRWAGNSSGYDDPRARRLAEAFRVGLTEPDQTQAMREISTFVAGELPILVLYYEADHIGVRTGVRAFDDLAGGAGSGSGYGLYTRNAHLWDVTS